MDDFQSFEISNDFSEELDKLLEKYRFVLNPKIIDHDGGRTFLRLPKSFLESLSQEELKMLDPFRQKI